MVKVKEKTFIFQVVLITGASSGTQIKNRSHKIWEFETHCCNLYHFEMQELEKL